MIKSRKAFTLIEVIFIITVLGILFSVAFPKLMTSREDAKIAVALAEMGMVVSEISSYYTTTGEFTSNIGEMTRVKNLSYTTEWNLTTEEGILTYLTSDTNNNLEECVSISLKNREGNVTVSNVVDINSAVCQRLQGHSMYQRLLGTRLVGGNRIQF
ncbi:type II secretion system GspH family protein [bacterium]|nr:type II secretion system GspH family protein [bacterium]MBU1957531.1 type II secretion system GspH family protein [bacterium]